jgi:hypothetical protein
MLDVDFKPLPSRAEDGKDARDGTVIYAMMTVCIISWMLLIIQVVGHTF